MSRVRALFASTVAILFAFAACENPSEVVRPAGDPGPALGSVTYDGDDGCTPTGTGLDAVVVNQDLDGATVLIGDCDVGAFFDEDGEVVDSRFEQPDSDPAPRVQHLVRVEGADVNVTGSEFQVDPGYAHQIVHVGYRDGATGSVAGNTLTGFKRAGILLDGHGTSAVVSGNAVTGVGPKMAGWAENGIQVSRGATATLKDNTVEDHWWDKNDFVSSGIIVFGSDGVTAQRNALAGNDAALVVVGDDNNFLQNTVDVTDEDGDASGVFHAGAIVSAGEDNGLRQNDFTSGSPDGSASFGVFVTAAATNTKLIRNSIDGFETPLVDQGKESKLPTPFEP